MGNRSTAQPIGWRLSGHAGPVMRMVFDSARPGVGYSADTLGVVRAWQLDMSVGPSERWRAQESGAVYALACASSGKTDVLLSAGAFERISIRACEDGRERTHLTFASDVRGSVRDLAVEPQSGSVFVATQAGMLLGYDLASGARRLVQTTGLSGLQSCAVRAEGAAGSVLLALGAADGRLARYQYHHGVGQLTALGTPQRPVPEAVLYGTTLHEATAATGSALVALASDGTLLFQAGGEERPQPIAQPKGEQYALAVSATGRFALVGGEAREIGVYRLPDGQRLATLASAGAPIWSLAISADARYAAAGDATGTLLLYELPSEWR